MNNLLIVVMFYRLIWNTFVIGGTAYLIQFYNWSPWWFVFAALLMVSGSAIKNDDDKEDEDNSQCGC